MTERNLTMIQGLRECADWLEAHPEICCHHGEVTIIPDHREEFAAIAKAMGKARKDFSDKLAYLYKDFGPLEVRAFTSRETVCERVVVGTKEIPATPEYVIPARESRVEEIIEWKCGSLLMIGSEGDHEQH